VEHQDALLHAFGDELAQTQTELTWRHVFVSAAGQVDHPII